MVELAESAPIAIQLEKMKKTAVEMVGKKWKNAKFIPALAVLLPLSVAYGALVLAPPDCYRVLIYHHGRRCWCGNFIGKSKNQLWNWYVKKERWENSYLCSQSLLA